MVRCGSKSGYQKDMSLKEIGECAQNLITTLGSIGNIIEGGTCMTIYDHSIIVTFTIDIAL